MIVREDFAYDVHVPVLVIGAGAAGMTAALAASDGGAEVVLIEQDRAPGGSTAMSYGGLCAAGTRSQARQGIADSPATFLADIMAMTHGETSPALARTIAEEAGPTVDWLVERHGVALDLAANWTGLGHSVPRMHFPPTQSGAELVTMLERAVEEAGIALLTSARVTELHADQDGRVRGVTVERPDGRERIGCDRLILATCGFGGNHQMVARHIPELVDARYFGHEGNRGDGIAWGQALGAAVADMGAYQALGSLSDPECTVVPPTLAVEGGIHVNRNGERFHDETVDVSGQALRVLAQPGAVAWIIYDRRLHEAARASLAEYREGEALNPYRSGDTVAALAAEIGLPAAPLAASIAEAEELKRTGGTDRFGRHFAGAAPLVPPYYAVRVTGALFHTQGGLCTDGEARVIDAAGKPLPNLYAAGGAARSVSGPGGWGYLPGMGICTALTLGRLAGRHAARVLEPA